MGVPYFKIEKYARQHGVAVFSSNYALYGDLSRRVMEVLAAYAPAYEIYSIDECFLDLSGIPGDLTAYTMDIVRAVRQWTGIPVSIGIAPTKTLAKIANRWLCQRRLHQGAFVWPKVDEAVFAISQAQWQWLIAGVDWQRLSAQVQPAWQI